MGRGSAPSAAGVRVLCCVRRAVGVPRTACHMLCVAQAVCCVPGAGCLAGGVVRVLCVLRYRYTALYRVIPRYTVVYYTAVYCGITRVPRVLRMYRAYSCTTCIADTCYLPHATCRLPPPASALPPSEVRVGRMSWRRASWPKRNALKTGLRSSGGEPRLSHCLKCGERRRIVFLA